MVTFAISPALVHLWPLVSRWHSAAAFTVAASGLATVAGTGIHAIPRRQLLFCSSGTSTPRRSRCAKAHFELGPGLGRAAHLALRPPSRVERVALVVGTVPAPRSWPPPLLGRSCVFWSGWAGVGAGGLSLLLGLYGGRLAAILRPRRCHGDKGTNGTHSRCYCCILSPSLVVCCARETILMGAKCAKAKAGHFRASPHQLKADTDFLFIVTS